MISRSITDLVVLIGPAYKPPRGGIAQMMSCYDELLFENMNYVVNSSKGKLRNLFLCIGAMFRLVWILSTLRKVRIVNIQTASGISFSRSCLFIKIAQWMRRKVIVHIHGGGFKIFYDRSPSQKQHVKRILQSVDAVIVLTESWKQQLSADLELDNLHCIHNIIPKPVVRSVHDDGKVHLLFMGLICDLKGIFDLVDVFAMIDDDVRSRIVFHVGGNGEVERFIDEVKRHKLEDVIHYEGWISGEQKIELLNKCEILLQPSYVEALSLTILEAMSYGKAILTTNVGGIPTIVKDNENGFLVEAGDKQMMALRLKQLIDDKQLRKRLGMCSATRVQAYFPENVSNELSELFSRLLDN